VKRVWFVIMVVAVLVVASIPIASAGSAKTMIGINVLLNTDANAQILADLATHGKVRDVVSAIRAVTMQVPAGELAAIRGLPYVALANPDAERTGAPIDTVVAADFSGGKNTWDLNAVNVSNFGAQGRQVAYDGSGVYVAVLDTGLLDSWRQSLPQERIATQFAVAFGGGGGEVGSISSQPNKWEHDQNSHGTHVTSTILGYNLQSTAMGAWRPWRRSSR